MEKDNLSIKSQYDTTISEKHIITINQKKERNIVLSTYVRITDHLNPPVRVLTLQNEDDSLGVACFENDDLDDFKKNVRRLLDYNNRFDLFSAKYQELSFVNNCL